MNNQTTPLRKRPCIWASFFSLHRYECFTLGGKTSFCKTSPLTAEFRASGEFKIRFVAPWTKVRTFEPVRKSSYQATPEACCHASDIHNDNQICGPTS